MFLLFLLRRLNPTARIITGAALVVAGVAAVLFVSFGIAFAVAGVIFIISGVRAKRRESRERVQSVHQADVAPRPFAQINE